MRNTVPVIVNPQAMQTTLTWTQRESNVDFEVDTVRFGVLWLVATVSSLLFTAILLICWRCTCLRTQTVLLVAQYKGWILFLGNAHVVTSVTLFHNVTWSWVQEDCVLIKFWKLRWAHTNQCHPISVVIQRYSAHVKGFLWETCAEDLRRC